jgi:rSAM/selenodomain-associated transferase 2
MTPTCRLSVVIPTWCEESSIERAVQAAARVGDEVIVADGGSPDRTVERAHAAGARVISAPAGRGPQLHAGALAARGDILLFLHADALLAPEARDAVLRALADPAVLGGNFRLRFDSANLAARIFSWANHLRRRWLRIYYGDSGLFLRRMTYQALGGFRPLPLFEDYELTRRLERAGRTVYLDDVEIRVSARRFERSPLTTLLVWTALQVLYSAGASAERLSRLYHRQRETGEEADRLPAGHQSL